MSQIGWFNFAYYDVDIGGGVIESRPVFALYAAEDVNGYTATPFGVIGGPFTAVVWSAYYVDHPEFDPVSPTPPLELGPYSGSVNLDSSKFVFSEGRRLIEITAVVDGVPATNSLWFLPASGHSGMGSGSIGYTLLGPSVPSTFWTNHIGAVET